MLPLKIPSPPATPPSSTEELRECYSGFGTPNIKHHTENCICIVGVGYVGKNLLSEFSRKFDCIGFDLSLDRIQALKTEFKDLSHVQLTAEESALSRATHYLISVPTSLEPDQTPDFQHLHSAVATVGRHARPGCVVVLESSVSIGTTRSLLGPLSGLLHCGMSPERVDPGRKLPAMQQIPKIISALDDTALQQISKIYSQIFDTVVPVTSPEVAEMTKLYENCFRMINIAFVNEIADACRSHNIDTKEVIAAASTKSFGFMPFCPGIGVGGNCIPVNPFYLFQNCHLPLLEQATTRMWNRPAETAQRLYEEYMKGAYSYANPRVLVVGIAFKPGEDVLSCSPGLAFAKELSEIGCGQLFYYDPLVAQENVTWLKKLPTSDWDHCFLDLNFDLIFICMRQVGIDFEVLRKLEIASVCFSC